MRRRLRNVTRRKVLGVGVVILLAACNRSPDGGKRYQPAVRISICDLLRDVSRYRGKTIALTGVYWLGLQQSCPQGFTTAQHTWPTAASLTTTDSVGDGEKLPFTTDRASWEELESLVMREARARHREEIWVTVVGLLRAPDSYVLNDGKVFRGYGPFNLFPVELVVQRVSKITINSTPTYDYGEIIDHPLE